MGSPRFAHGGGVVGDAFKDGGREFPWEGGRLALDHFPDVQLRVPCKKIDGLRPVNC